MAQSYFTTVQEAIERGKMNLQTIPFACYIAGSGISALFFFKELWIPATAGQPIDGFHFGVLKFMGIAAAGLLAGFAWRNFHSAAWKIWALENVLDVHRLFQLAEQKSMIGKRGSWLNNLELATAEQKTRLAELETRLDGPRLMEPAAALPSSETREFPYSKKVLFFQFAGILPFFGFMYLMDHKISFFPVGLFLLVFLGITAFRWLPRIGRPAPLQLSPEGILIDRLPLLAWGEVADILLENRRHGKSSKTVLVFSTKTPQPKPFELELTDIAGDDDAIEQAAHDFWANWRAKQR